MFDLSQFSVGTRFNVKGDPSEYKCIGVEDNKIIAVNNSSGTTGPIHPRTVTRILNVATANIESKDISISFIPPKKKKGRRG